MPRLDDSVRLVRGFGAKKAEALRTLGIQTVGDALLLYPRDYEDRTHIVPIASVGEGDKVCIRAVVGTAPVMRHIRRGMDITKLTLFDESGAIEVTYFNNRYTAAALQVGEEYLFYGRIQGKPRQMLSPAVERCMPGAANGGRIVPVYPLTAGISQKDMMRLTQEALSAITGEYPEFLPDYLLFEYQLPNLSEALFAIHRPNSLSEVIFARRRMVFEELFLLCCGLLRLKEERRATKGIVFANSDMMPFWNTFPYAPTSAQLRAVQAVNRDVTSGRPLNRLVQGDVGSGKTVVAAALCYQAAINGYQAAIMAPTEILAAQHYETLSKWFSKLGIDCALLTGSMGAAAKRAIQEKIAQGQVRIVIGTHAIIQKEVSFDRLGAVVADEQHRFGVTQRAALTEKGAMPHTLVMSATPIPRTLALIMYGDLDVSVLDELPPGRQPIETYAVGEKMRQRVYRFLEKQLVAGGQAYVVCPLVEEGEINAKGAQQHVKDLKKVLPHRKIALLHGRMKPRDKEEVMQAFSAGEIDVLVATTVVEVGVNVPNATVMIVEDADRFGLSQLHQLRGRVGRGNRQSYCIFFGADKGEKARERLKLLASTADGFEIARADLAQRGPGDFFGQRQHGLPDLHIADLAADLELMQSAREEAEKLLQQDWELNRYAALRERVEKMFAVGGMHIFN